MQKRGGMGGVNRDNRAPVKNVGSEARRGTSCCSEGGKIGPIHWFAAVNCKDTEVPGQIQSEVNDQI